MVIERFGRYACTLTAGFNAIIPTTRNRARSSSATPGSCPMAGSTSSSSRRRRSTCGRWSMTSPNRTHHEGQRDHRDQCAALPAGHGSHQGGARSRTCRCRGEAHPDHLRNAIGELDLDETLTSRETINAKLRIIPGRGQQQVGVKVNRVELQDIIPRATSPRPWRSRCAPSATDAPW